MRNLLYFLIIILSVLTSVAYGELVNLRTLTNATGVVFDEARTANFYAEDYNRIKAAIQSGTSEINTQGVRLEPQVTDITCPSGRFGMWADANDAEGTIKTCVDGINFRFGNMTFNWFFNPTQQFGVFSPNGGGNWSNFGIYGGGTESCPAGGRTDRSGHFNFCDSSSSATGLESDHVHQLEAEPYVIGKFHFRFAATGYRFFCGFTTETDNTMTGSNTVNSGQYVGIQSIPDTDTSWRVISRDGTTVNTVDTGITVVLNDWYYCRIYGDENAMMVQVLDENFNLLVSENVTSNLPAADTDIRTVMAIDPLTGTRGIGIQYLYGMNSSKNDTDYGEP